jgi:hypothetical protein
MDKELFEKRISEFNEEIEKLKSILNSDISEIEKIKTKHTLGFLERCLLIFEKSNRK